MTAIMTLLNSCGPSAIAWGVIAIIVFAVESETRMRAASHVLEEVLELIPSATDSNASPAVILILATLWIVAASSHVAPCPIFRSTVAVPCMAVANWSPQTTATFFRSSREAITTNLSRSTAGASTQPYFRANFILSDNPYRSEASEAFSCEWRGVSHA